jgi:hypothetical protein
MLAFRHKVSARSFLYQTCACGTLLHLTCTYGTCSYSSVMLAIHHKSLCSVLSPSDVYLRDPSTFDLWDQTAYVSCVPMGPFSISIWPVGHDDLRVTWRLQFIIKISTRSFLHPTCTCGTLLHPTYGIWQLTCHVYLCDLSPSPSNLWDPTASVSLVPCVPSRFNFSKKKFWYLAVEPRI